MNDTEFLIAIAASTKHGPGGLGWSGNCAEKCVKCEAEHRLRELHFQSKPPKLTTEEKVAALLYVRGVLDIHLSRVMDGGAAHSITMGVLTQILDLVHGGG